MGFTHLQIEWNPWLGGYCPQISVLSAICPQLNLLTPPQKKKILGTPLQSVNKWQVVCFLLGDSPPVNHPEGSIQHTENNKSLRSRTNDTFCLFGSVELYELMCGGNTYFRLIISRLLQFLLAVLGQRPQHSLLQRVRLHRLPSCGLQLRWAHVRMSSCQLQVQQLRIRSLCPELLQPVPTL
jgi:hypothetical protein